MVIKCAPLERDWNINIMLQNKECLNIGITFDRFIRGCFTLFVKIGLYLNIHYKITSILYLKTE